MPFSSHVTPVSDFPGADHPALVQNESCDPWPLRFCPYVHHGSMFLDSIHENDSMWTLRASPLHFSPCAHHGNAFFSLTRVQVATSASRSVGHVFFPYVPPVLSSSVRRAFVTENFHSSRPCSSSADLPHRWYLVTAQILAFDYLLPTPAASARLLHPGTLHFACVRSSTAPDGNIRTYGCCRERGKESSPHWWYVTQCAKIFPLPVLHEFLHRSAFMNLNLCVFVPQRSCPTGRELRLAVPPCSHPAGRQHRYWRYPRVYCLFTPNGSIDSVLVTFSITCLNSHALPPILMKPTVPFVSHNWRFFGAMCFMCCKRNSFPLLLLQPVACMV
jgi:hypothetical protein